MTRDNLAQRRRALFTALTVLDFRYAAGPEPPLLSALRTWLSPAGPASAASSPG